MTQDATNHMQADKALIRDLEKAATPEEIRSLLHSAVERSGIANRDPETGQFVRRNPLTPAAQVIATNEPKQIERIEKINGQDIHFVGTELEVEKQIANAYKVAEALKPAPEPRVPIVRQKTQAEIEREISDRAELDLQFRRGQLTTQEYLQRTNAIGEFLAARGFDVDAAAQAQANAEWAQATEEFLATTPEWRGGSRNMQQIGTIVLARGWDNAENKVAALRAAFKEMQDRGMEFDGDVSEEQLIEMTDKATPQEILDAWKETHPDPEKANKAFIEIHRKAGDSSGIFNR